MSPFLIAVIASAALCLVVTGVVVALLVCGAERVDRETWEKEQHHGH